jgi:hypothetical protein
MRIALMTDIYKPSTDGITRHAQAVLGDMGRVSLGLCSQ